jgi:preprotein translocase subunit YajC
MGLIILPLLFLAMWWFTIRPQQQRLRAQRELVAALQVGDVVLTAGGVVGRIVSMDDDEVMLDAGRGTPVEVRVVRGAVSKRIVPNETTAD